jgi:hypothetical protein
VHAGVARVVGVVVCIGKHRREYGGGLPPALRGIQALRWNINDANYRTAAGRKNAAVFEHAVRRVDGSWAVDSSPKIVVPVTRPPRHNLHCRRNAILEDAGTTRAVYSGDNSPNGRQGLVCHDVFQRFVSESVVWHTQSRILTKRRERLRPCASCGSLSVNMSSRRLLARRTKIKPNCSRPSVLPPLTCKAADHCRQPPDYCMG